MLDKLDNIIDTYTYLSEAMDKFTQRKLDRRDYLKNCEDMYLNNAVDFKLCGPYIKDLLDEEKREVYKYIRRQKENKELNIWDYMINVLKIYG